MKLETVKAIFFWFALSLIGGLIAFQIYKRDQMSFQEIPVEPRQAPDFSLDGVSLNALKGNRVLLHFWATWCAPCREEMPILISMAKRLGDQITILAIAVDSSAEEVNAFFGAQKPPFQVLIDSKNEVARKYGVSQFPESMLVNADGMIEALYLGPQDWEQFKL